MKQTFTLEEVNKILTDLFEYSNTIIEEAKNDDALTEYKYGGRTDTYPIRIGREIRRTFERLNELDIAKEYNLKL